MPNPVAILHVFPLACGMRTANRLAAARMPQASETAGRRSSRTCRDGAADKMAARERDGLELQWHAWYKHPED